MYEGDYLAGHALMTPPVSLILPLCFRCGEGRHIYLQFERLLASSHLHHWPISVIEADKWLFWKKKHSLRSLE